MSVATVAIAMQRAAGAGTVLGARLVTTIAVAGTCRRMSAADRAGRLARSRRAFLRLAVAGAAGHRASCSVSSHLVSSSPASRSEAYAQPRHRGHQPPDVETHEGIGVPDERPGHINDVVDRKGGELRRPVLQLPTKVES